MVRLLHHPTELNKVLQYITSYKLNDFDLNIKHKILASDQT